MPSAYTHVHWIKCDYIFFSIFCDFVSFLYFDAFAVCCCITCARCFSFSLAFPQSAFIKSTKLSIFILSHFFNINYQSEAPKHKCISLECSIGVICSSVAFVHLIIGINIFIFHRSPKENLEKTASSFNLNSSSNEKENQIGLSKLALNEDDQWNQNEITRQITKKYKYY